MPLLDIKDFREILRFITNEGKENIKVKIEAAAEYMIDYDFEQLIKKGKNN